MIEYPVFLSMTALLPVILFWGIYRIRSRRTALLRFSERGSEAEYVRYQTGRNSAALFLVLVLFTALLLSLSGFTREKQAGMVRSDRVNIVFSVDISRSMLAADMGTSRLEFVKQGMRSIMRIHESGRYGIVAFKGDAVTMVPLTEDSRALDLFIESLSPALISSPGTNLAAGLKEALRAFPEGTGGHRVVVLFSDGESTAGRPEEAVREAAAEGIPVVSIPVGTVSGAAIELGGGKYVRNAEGERVISRVMDKRLEEIAEKTGGFFLSPGRLEQAASLAAAFAPWVDETAQKGYRLVRVDRYRLFLLPALLALIGYCLLRRLG